MPYINCSVHAQFTKPQLFPVFFMDNPPINVQDIIPSIFVFSVNSLLSPFPPAAAIGPGSGNYLGMEDIFIQLNIAVHHGSNMSFWLLHVASERSYQKCLAILSMLRRAFKGRYALLRDRLVFVEVAIQESPREHIAAKPEGSPCALIWL